MDVKCWTYTCVVNKAEEGGYVAKRIQLPEVHTQGETMAEVKKTMRDALTLAVDNIREKDKFKLRRIDKMVVRTNPRAMEHQKMRTFTKKSWHNSSF